jgi:hypothetical protein
VAGLSIRPERVEAFADAFGAVADARLDEDDLQPVTTVDALAHGADLTLELCAELASLAPFGLGNPAVTLLAPGCELVEPATVGEGRHLRFRVRRETGEDGGGAIAWRLGPQLDRFRRAGLRYARHHSGRLAAVIGARLLRTFGLYQPVRQARHAEGRAPGLEIAGAFAFYAVAALALAGAVVLRRRGAALSVLLAPFLVVVVATAAGYGVPRFRQPVDIVLVVLGGVALDALLQRRAQRPRETTGGATGAGSTIASPRAAGVSRLTRRLSDSAGRSTR